MERIELLPIQQATGRDQVLFNKINEIIEWTNGILEIVNEQNEDDDKRIAHLETFHPTPQEVADLIDKPHGGGRRRTRKRRKRNRRRKTRRRRN